MHLLVSQPSLVELNKNDTYLNFALLFQLFCCFLHSSHFQCLLRMILELNIVIKKSNITKMYMHDQLFVV